MKGKRPYVQFSKRIVIAVNCAVFTVVVCGLVLASISGSTDQITAIVRIFVEYAMVVFAAYSGNSAVEKWLVMRGPRIIQKNTSASDDDEEEESEDNEG